MSADQSVEVVDGPIEETILRVAQDYHADMIAMPTAGHHGFLDALRGSTLSRARYAGPDHRAGRGWFGEVVAALSYAPHRFPPP
jgi:hypothetical protein